MLSIELALASTKSNIITTSLASTDLITKMTTAAAITSTAETFFASNTTTQPASMAITTTMTTNISGSDHPVITSATIFWTAYNTLIMICILTGNALTILAITTCRRLRSLISNNFILSLAISDFAVGITLPYHIAFYLGSNFSKSEYLCLLRFFSMIFTCCVSILTLISIAVDRYIAILYALHYRRFMTRRLSISIIAFNWFTGAFVALIPVLTNRYKTAHDCEFYDVLPIWYMAGIITPGFILIWLVMLFIYWRIMRESAKQSKLAHRNRGTTQCTKSSSSKLRARIPDWKSMQVVCIIMGCFSICWLTYFIVVCMEILNIYNKSNFLYKIAFSLAVSNSAMNPIIYCWKNATFRRAYCRLLCCKNPNYNSPCNASEFPAASILNSIQDSPQQQSNTVTISIIPLAMGEEQAIKAKRILFK